MSTRTISAQNFLCAELLHTIRNFLPLPFLRVGGKRVSTEVRHDLLIESLVQKARELDLDQERFEQVLAEHVNALIAGEKPTDELESLVLAYSDELEGRIHAIPNTPEKAQEALLALIDVGAFLDGDQVYDAMVLLRSEISSEVVAGVVRNWKLAARKHKEEHKSSPSYMSCQVV